MIATILIIFATGPLIFLIYSYWYQNYSRIFKYINRVPAPPGYPIIGHMIAAMASQEQFFKNDRKKAFDHYPIYRMSVLNVGMITLLLPEDVELVLSGMKHIKKSKLYELLHPWLGTGLLTSDGTKWQGRRKILTPAFHFNILQTFVDIFNDETTKLVQNVSKRLNEPYIDVVPIITELTLFAVAETSMGTKLGNNSEDNKIYKQSVYDFGKYFNYRLGRPWLFVPSIFQFTPTARAFNKVIDLLHNFSESVIRERKAAFQSHSYATGKRLAMLDLLLTAQSNGADIDDEGIREEVDTFIFEGHDTTSVALCFVLMLLANHRQVQEEIYQEMSSVLDNSDSASTYYQLQEMSFLERCLKECLRLYPSVHFIAREASEDFTTVSGYLIPKGTMIHVPIYDIHHNSELYPDPEKFDPDRFLSENTKSRHPFAYIPFSAGPRNCIGQKFAMLELKAVVCGILKNFVLEPVDRPEDLVLITDLVLRSKNGVKIKFVPRVVDQRSSV